MNVPLIVGSAALSIAAFLDGWTTVQFLKKPNLVETNVLFGSRPSTLRVWLEGAALIAAEIGFAIYMNSLSHYLGYAFAAGFGIQAGVHIAEALHNEKLIKLS